MMRKSFRQIGLPLVALVLLPALASAQINTQPPPQRPAGTPASPRPAPPAAMPPSTPVPANQPATAPSDPVDAKMYELSQRAIQLAESLQRTVGPREQLFDPQYRQTIAPQVVPLLKDSIAIADEFFKVGGQGPAIGLKVRYDALCMLAAFDDRETVDWLNKAADAPDGGMGASRAKQALIFGEWIRSNGAPAGQHSALDKAQALAASAPANDEIAHLLLTLLDASPANKDVRDRVLRIISTELTGPLAKNAAVRIEARQKRLALEGKPLLILGVRYNRQMFSSRAWQGRVVMVVFWDSANKACQAEVPRWVRLFEQHNKNGLEIVGVSCDQNGQDLLRWKATHPRMAWPELFDTEQPGWHALATELGVTDLPTVMLIDKNGVCRSTEAGEDLDEQIRRLIAE
jgi:hypothetical protein